MGIGRKRTKELIVEKHNMNMILDALELLAWIIKTKELFGLSNNYQYTEDEVNHLYQSLENNT